MPPQAPPAKTGANLHSSMKPNLKADQIYNFLYCSGTSTFDSYALHNHDSNFTHCHLSTEEPGFECIGGINDITKFKVFF
jgi:hypothetical protein